MNTPLSNSTEDPIIPEKTEPPLTPPPLEPEEQPGVVHDK
ncbi:MAG: hypothetical protein JWR15_2404, partial [Prosthecobacter sp.]|nr:hypothetical protein [Prosthecobacter sp.]